MKKSIVKSLLLVIIMMFFSCSSEEDFSLEINKESIDFGKIELRREARFQDLKIRKVGGPKITVTSVNFIGDRHGEFFAGSLSVGDVFYGDESMSGFTVYFTPKEVGGKNVTLEVKTSSGDVVTMSIVAEATEASVIDVPDREFKEYLLGLSSLNKDGDDEIQVIEGELNSIDLIEGGDFKNLKGIESLKKLEQFSCFNNDLIENIDLVGCEELYSVVISNNVNLKSVKLPTNLEGFTSYSNNKLVIDASKAVNIIGVKIKYQELNGLDLSSCERLSGLHIEGVSKLEGLDLSSNSKLEDIIVKNSYDLTWINIANSKNIELKKVDLWNNTSLNCVQVDPDFTIPTDGAWTKDAHTTYSVTSCN
jgi:hypothetical protein